MLKYDRWQDQINLWLLWTLATTVGCSFGWASGEALGRIVYNTFGWTLGHVVAWGTFEAVLWVARGQILSRISTVPVWRRLDSQVWASAELFAWALGEGIHQLSPTLWLTGSAVWGVIGGAAIWFILACARQAKPGRWFVLAGTAYGLIGLIGGIVFLSFTMVLSEEMRQAAETMAIPLLGWLLAGALLGVAAGALTGVAVARLWLAVPAHE